MAIRQPGPSEATILPRLLRLREGHAPPTSPKVSRVSSRHGLAQSTACERESSLIWPVAVSRLFSPRTTTLQPLPTYVSLCLTFQSPRLVLSCQHAARISLTSSALIALTSASDHPPHTDHTPTRVTLAPSSSPIIYLPGTERSTRAITALPQGPTTSLTVSCPP